MFFFAKYYMECCYPNKNHASEFYNTWFSMNKLQLNKSMFIDVRLEHLQLHSIFHSKIEFRVKNVPMVLYFSLCNRVKNRFTLNIE